MRKKLFILGMVFLIGLFLLGCETDLLDESYELTMVEVSGTQTINIPEEGAGPVIIPFTAAVRDQYGNEMIDEGVNWSVENVDGNDVNNFVTIDSYGVVTVTSDASEQQDSFKVVATSETDTDISGQLIVSLNVVPEGTYEVTMVKVSGTDTINIPEEGAGPVTVSYTATVRDQFGSEMSGEGVNWSVENVEGNDANNYVTIDPYGEVTVTSDATVQQDSFKIVATSETNTDISGQLIVSLNAVPEGTYEVTMVEVSGTDTINIPEEGADPVTAPYTATVKDQFGSEMSGEGVNWSVENVNGNDANNFVTIDSYGVVTVTSEASEQQDSFKVVATSETNTDISGQLIVSLESIQTTDPVNLGTAGSYVILSHAGITNDSPSVITGDIGVSPIDSTAITGFSLIMDSSNEFSTSAQITGKVYAADYASPTPANLTTAVGDKGTAYTDAAGRAADHNELGSGDISNLTLAPGVYKWGTGVSINGDVTLDGTATDVWIFQISGQLTQAANTSIILTGNAKAENIFWQVGETVAIGTGAHFEGIVLGWTDITLGTGASVNGRLFSLNENVTLLQNTITEP